MNARPDNGQWRRVIAEPATFESWCNHCWRVTAGPLPPQSCVWCGSGDVEIREPEGVGGCGREVRANSPSALGEVPREDEARITEGQTAARGRVSLPASAQPPTNPGGEGGRAGNEAGASQPHREDLTSTLSPEEDSRIEWFPPDLSGVIFIRRRQGVGGGGGESARRGGPVSGTTHLTVRTQQSDPSLTDSAGEGGGARSASRVDSNDVESVALSRLLLGLIPFGFSDAI
jgi:hypothetical protein